MPTLVTSLEILPDKCQVIVWDGELRRQETAEEAEAKNLAIDSQVKIRASTLVSYSFKRQESLSEHL